MTAVHFALNKLRLFYARSGGLELLFDNQKVFDAVDVDAPANVVPGTPVTMRHALHWIREHLLRQRPELFLSGDTV